MANKRKINDDTILYQDEDAIEYESEDDSETPFADEEQEDIPEAFIPEFTVAPDAIPVESQVIPPDGLPSEDEQASILKRIYEKLGLNVKAAIHQPSPPMTQEKDHFVHTVGQLGAQMVSALMGWVFSIPGWEYSVLAPHAEEAQRIIEPLLRIYARHSKVVGNITPDMNDIIESLTALSGYALVSTQMLAMIKEDKARNNGQVTTQSQVRPSFTTTRPDDIRRNTSNGYQPVEDSAPADTQFTRDLTDDERRNYEALLVLTERDYQYRARRSGRV